MNRPALNELWKQMQQVEANRHAADRLEALAHAAWTEKDRQFFTRLAAKRREIADESYALWRKGQRKAARAASGLQAGTAELRCSEA